MLHEEVVVDWNSLERQIADPKLLEAFQMDFAFGVGSSYIIHSTHGEILIIIRCVGRDIIHWSQDA